MREIELPQGAKAAIASMVSGMIALALALSLFSLVSIGFAVVSIFCAASARKDDGYKEGMSMAGIVCSIIALVVMGVAIFVACRTPEVVWTDWGWE